MPQRETPYHRQPGYAEHYRDRRFTAAHGPATDRRERRVVTALVHQAAAGPGTWLDVPSGAGRLSGLLPGAVVQVDRDLQMLKACGPGLPRACASAGRLPFPDGAFAGALCMRLLQHIPHADERTAILAELGRVSRDAVIVSFFDAHSLQHWRRRLRRALGKPRSSRGGVSRSRFLAELRAAGLRPERVVALRRFFSEQTLVLARPTRT